jgi:hypothetical protein
VAELGGFAVVFPAFPEIVIFGRALEEARAMRWAVISKDFAKTAKRFQPRRYRQAIQFAKRS